MDIQKSLEIKLMEKVFLSKMEAVSKDALSNIQLTLKPFQTKNNFPLISFSEL